MTGVEAAAVAVQGGAMVIVVAGSAGVLGLWRGLYREGRPRARHLRQPMRRPIVLRLRAVAVRVAAGWDSFVCSGAWRLL